MSRYRFGLALVVGLSCSTPVAWAILIDTGTGRVGGFLLNDDGTKLKISIPTPDGEDKVGDYLRAEVKILHQLDVKRLEGLSRANPRGYRDYADELARQKDDPEARYVAMRLYLIAAKLAPAEFGSSSLLAMSKLAGTAAEARRCRAMAFLLDPKGDPEILRRDAAKTRPVKLPEGALEDFTRALRYYRAGQIKLASETAKHEGVDKVFGKAPGKVDLKTFFQWCSDAGCTTCRADGTVRCPTCKGNKVIRDMFNRVVRCPTCKTKGRVVCPDCGGTHVRDPLPEDALRAALRCELWAMEQQGAGDKAGRTGTADAKSWSAVLQSGLPPPVLPLRLETITRFDPNQCLYRNRKWVADEAP